MSVTRANGTLTIRDQLIGPRFKSRADELAASVRGLSAQVGTNSATVSGPGGDPMVEAALTELQAL